MMLRKIQVLKGNKCFQPHIIIRKLESGSGSYDDQYLQRSKVPTMHFQPSLPRLPIPELSKSCSRYLRSQRPLLSDEDYKRVKMIVKNFETGDGMQLHKELCYRDSKNKHTSYISAPWYDMYLSDRNPLPLNVNPGIAIINDPKPEFNDQTIRATNMIYSTLRFLKSLRENLLEPEVFHLNPKKSDTKFFRTVTGMLPPSLSWYGAYLFKAYPLDMSQYKNLFNTTRLPRTNKDELYYDPKQKNIIIMKGGNFYSMDVIDNSGNIIDKETLFSCLSHIINDPRKSKYPVGILTSMERNDWAKTRSYLEKLGNESVLKSIDGSLFVLALDDDKPDDYETICRAFLHSDGCNRWFDKCFSLIISQNGLTGVNFEHSWGDGVAILRYITELYKNSTGKPAVFPGSHKSNINPQDFIKPLEFVLDGVMENKIKSTEKNFNETINSLDINCVEYNKMGRDFARKSKISPDSLMQLAFQVTQYKLSGKFVGTYESCSTSAFKHGRTETMRPCTIETSEFCKSLAAKVQPSKTDLRNIMAKCSDIHSNLVKEAAMGQGFDRHFFALRKIAEEQGKQLDIFSDPSYANLNHYILSTSTLSSEIVLIGSFGPVVSDGVGIGYSIFKERLGCIVSSYKNGASGKDFIEALYKSLDEIHDILV